MDVTQKVRAALDTSAGVLKGSQLANGAIVASTSEPNGLQDYRFVWARDASFVLYASRLLDIEGMQHRYLDWLEERCSDYIKTGRIYKNYTIRGARAHDQYQPDQVGALLWALLDNYHGGDAQIDRVSRKLADALVGTWGNNGFTLPVYDLWEFRVVSAGVTPFSYTLASCATGLELAARYHGVDQWQQAANSMRSLVHPHAHDGYLWRSDRPDLRKTDASLLGLFWPFVGSYEAHALEQALQRVEKQLSTQKGIHRFPDDPYDGHVAHNDTSQGGGVWPLLSFWHVIILAKLGERDKATRLFDAQVELMPDDCVIPEQYFSEPERFAIKPLAWSHAMFVAACAELGLL